MGIEVDDALEDRRANGGVARLRLEDAPGGRVLETLDFRRV